MDKEKFGELIASRLELMVPNKDYTNVLLSNDELKLLIDTLEAINEFEDFKDHPEHDRLRNYLLDYYIRSHYEG